ncbi:MAG TPA: hypothetical protein VHJ20_18540 [Polyangia bacterium]|nr:hypothetical protein [Polyangia bacterium]
MADEATGAELALARQLATLAWSRVRPAGAAEAAQAVAWWNALARLGVQLPLVVVHDLGLFLARAHEAAAREVGRGGGAAPGGQILERYHALVAAAAASDAAADLRAASPADAVVAVVLARVVGDVYARWTGRPRLALSDAGPLPVVSPLYARAPGELARAHDPAWALPFVQRLVEHERGVLTRLDQIEVGALRVLGLFAVEASGGAGGRDLTDLADLYRLVGSTAAADVVDFSLQLLPSLLETKRRAAAQLFSIDGYASVERRGSLDALLPGELAHDDETFELKALSDDLLYYGHERRQDAARRLNYVLVDASASMRGAREVFARGLALALAKALTLRGGDVWLRFFDSRLHERFDVARAPRRELPRFLTFRSERGRNYARVFGDLGVELGRLRRESAREIAVTFISHAECRIPPATVDALAREAALTGVFVLPSRPLDLPYLSRLRRHHVVTAETLARAAEKRRRALDIVTATAVR